jgi:UPF0755 protein
MQKKKLKYIILGTVAAIALGLIILAISMILEFCSTGEGKGEVVLIEVEQGEGVWDIAKKLEDNDVINHKIIFYLKVRSMGVAHKLRYGSFEMRQDEGLKNIIEELIYGGAQLEAVMFTVLEGHTIEIIAKELEKAGLCTEEEFLDAVREDYDYWFLEDIPKNPDVKFKLQGFLFPDTYALVESMTAREIVTRMLDQFEAKFTEEMKQKAQSMGKSIYQVVIEASIVERETMLEIERSMVAGVIKNRIEKGMKLEMCPTVLYPLTNGMYDKTSVTKEDTKLESPYNTYQNKGFPPGPIACPGLASLEGVLNPTDHEFLYYHTDTIKNDGSHIFTKTYQEHINTQ